MSNAGAPAIRSGQTASQSSAHPRESVLDDFLRRVHLLGNSLHSARVLGWTLVAAVVAALVAIFSDVAFAWPTVVRIAIDGAIAAAVIVALFAAMSRFWLRRYDAPRAARLVEDRLSRGDSLLVNAVEFGTDANAAGSPILKSRVVRMADEFVRDMPASRIVSARPAARAGAAAIAAVIAFAVFGFIAPKLFGMVVPRFLDPTGDHPPYTLLSFKVTISPQPVYHSKAASIAADIRGADRVEEATLVFVDDHGQRDASLPEMAMFRAEDRRFVAEIGRAEKSRRFYVQTPRGRSETFDLEVTAVPFFEDARATLTPPTYTGWKPQEQKLDQRGIRGLAGTFATITARSNLPLESGRITIFPARAKGDADASQSGPMTIRLEPIQADARIVAGQFPIEFNGRFELSLKATSGGESPEPISGPITALPDRVPQVSIVSPDEYLVAVEGWKVPVLIEAADDVRVAKLKLYRTVNGWSPIPVEVPVDSAAPHAARSGYEFDLDTLGAKAGDVITYYANVVDNYPGDPHSADSATHTLQVISQEEYKEFARQQYQMDELTEEFESFQKEMERLAEERQKALEQLEELQKKAEQEGGLTPEEQKQAEDLAEQLQKFADDVDELKKKLDERAQQMQLYELEKEYTEQLQKLSKQLEQQAKNSSDVAEQLSKMGSPAGNTPEARERLQQAAEKFKKESDPFNQESLDQMNQTAEDLELMQMADAMMAQTDRLKAVIAQQRDLANRMAEMAGKESLSPDEQQRAERFAKEQELLQQELQSLQKDLEDAAKQSEERLPKMAESARQICEKIAEQQITDDQQSAAQGAREGNGDQAHQKAESAARKLEALQAMAGECQQCKGLQEGLDGPLSLSKERLGQCLSQLAQGRKVPGLGQRGNNRGKGQGGQSGGRNQGQMDGQGEGSDQPGQWKPGQSFPGSQANMQVMGPRTREATESESKNATMQSDGRGRYVSPDSTGLPADHESLNPETREFSGSSAGNLRGVPVGYRDAAEAYFRRLAEEQKRK